jgi:hypothetical protein
MQPFGWYVNRLRAMSVAEVSSRGTRLARHALERAGALRADRPPAPSAWPPTEERALAAPEGIDSRPYIDAADRIKSGWFDCFGESFRAFSPPHWNVDPKTGVRAPLSYGKTLDYRDARLVGDIKYLWELNRHLEVVTLAQAYAASGDRSYLETLRAFIGTWIEQCPYPRGPNWCSSLELAIRLINWHLAYLIAGGARSPLFDGEAGQRFAADWLKAIYQHMHFIMGHLSSYSSANNHLIGELAGTYVAACTWPCWPEAERWRRRAESELCEQVDLQTHPDGVNREQAVSYQQFVMYFLLIAGLAGQRTAQPFPDAYWAALQRMTGFVDALLDAGGNMPMIGDADDGIVFALAPKQRFEPFREVLGLCGELFADSRWRERAGEHHATALWLTGRASTPVARSPGGPPPTQFPDGGYYILGDRLGEPDEIRLIVDAGPVGYLSIAAHGHADCLALILSVAGKELLVDPGTYCYHTLREWRDYFRGTAAHNTVRIDGMDQSQISGPFMWAEKAEASVEEFQSSASGTSFRAKHTGYTRLDDPVTHHRAVTLDKRLRTIDVVDEIRCEGRHRVERFWQFSEHCEVELAERIVTVRNGAVLLTVETVEAESTGRLLRGELAPIGGWISRRFGHKQPTFTVVFVDDIEGSRTLRTRMSVAAPR